MNSLGTIKTLRRMLFDCILDDIKQNGTPAKIYYYDYNNRAVTILHDIEDFKKIQKNISKIWVGDAVTLDIVIDFNQLWNCRLWTYQPINCFGQNIFQEMTNYIYDPIGLVFGHVISGFCYLEPIKKIN